MDTALSSFSEFAHAFELDGNNVELYDRMVDRLLLATFGDNCRFIADHESIDAKIRMRKALTARFAVQYNGHEYMLDIPVMVGSRYAPGWSYDPNKQHACFIIDGLKYALVSMDQRNFNEPYVHKHNTLGPQALYVVHIDHRILSVSVHIDNTVLMVTHKKVSFTVAQFVAFMSDMYSVSQPKILVMIQDACKSCTASTKVLTYVRSSLRGTSDTADLQHDEATRVRTGLQLMGTIDSHCYILAILIVKIGTVIMEQHDYDDMDDEAFKRVECASTLVETAIARICPSDAADKLRMINITGQLETHFRGDKFKSRSYTSAQGVAFEAPATTPIELLSCARRVKTFMHEDIVQPRVRLLNPSHYGFLCAYETSESKSAGLSKALASTAVLSLPLHTDVIMQVLRDFGLSTHIVKDTMVPVFIDGIYAGWTNRPDAIVRTVIGLKRTHTQGDWTVDARHRLKVTPMFKQRRPAATNDEVICPCPPEWRYVSAYRSKQAVCILVSEGRICRPMLRVDTDCSWVEMVDMAAYKNIPPDADWKWCELYDNSMVGIAAGVNPLYNMTQAPRVTYQASMVKQALSLGYDKFNSTENQERILLHPQRPVVTSDIGAHYIDSFADYRDQNVIVAIMSDVRNNEDALIVNEDSVHRGLMRTCKVQHERVFRVDTKPCAAYNRKEVRLDHDTTSRSEVVFAKTDFSECKRDVFIDGVSLGTSSTSVVSGDKFWDSIGMNDDVIVVGDEVMAKLTEYGTNVAVPTFDINGTATVGTRISKRGAIQTMINLNKIKPDVSYSLSELHSMVIVETSMHTGSHNRDEDVVEITVRAYKSLEVGDKVETLHSQKSIVCNLVPGHYLPYDEQGIRPDFIINPHSIPSRMTVSTLFVALLGLEICKGTVQGPRVIGTFDGSIDAAKRELSGSGYVTLRCGRTGHKLQCEVFMGVLPYRCLKHQVIDKSASRHTGEVDVIHGQPVSGRRRNGGTRMGNMEQRALEAYGASNIMVQRNRVQTCEATVQVCIACGMQSQLVTHCSHCSNMPLLPASTTQSYQVFERLMETMSVTQHML